MNPPAAAIVEKNLQDLAVQGQNGGYLFGKFYFDHG
jgi:hypothetical protein